MEKYRRGYIIMARDFNNVMNINKDQTKIMKEKKRNNVDQTKRKETMFKKK